MVWQDVSYQLSLEYPEIYVTGQRRELINFRVFFKWVFEAIYGATMIFFIPYVFMVKGGTTSSGVSLDLQQIGLTMYTINVISVTLRLAMETQYFTYLHHIAYFGSIMLWYLFMLIEFAFPTGFAVTDGYMYWSSYNMWSTTYHWLALLLAVWVIVLPAFARNCYVHNFHPTVNEIARELANEAQANQAAEELRIQEEELSASPETLQRRRNTATRVARSDVGHNEINLVHAVQRRSSKRPSDMMRASVSKVKNRNPAFSSVAEQANASAAADSAIVNC